MLGPVAQLVEHGTENAGVGGSTPPWATNSEKKRLRALFFVVGLVGTQASLLSNPLHRHFSCRG